MFNKLFIKEIFNDIFYQKTACFFADDLNCKGSIVLYSLVLLQSKCVDLFLGTFRWFKLQSIYMFGECSWNIPMGYSQYIRKKSPMKFREIFRNNVPGILNTGIFPVPSIYYQCYMYF